MGLYSTFFLTKQYLFENNISKLNSFGISTAKLAVTHNRLVPDDTVKLIHIRLAICANIEPLDVVVAFP